MEQLNILSNMDVRNPHRPLDPTRLTGTYFRFLDLPRELRDEVYRHLRFSDTVSHPHDDRRNPVSSDPAVRHSNARASSITAVMCACSQLHNEARKVLYHNLSLNLTLWSDFRHHRLLRNGDLPARPILEAQTLSIKITTLGQHGCLVERLRFGRDNPVEAEYQVSCLAAEMVALATLLRRRGQRMPAIRVHFLFTHLDSVPFFDWRWVPFPWESVERLLLPLRSLTRVPAGGVQVCIDRPLGHLPDWRSQMNSLASAVREDTGGTGPKKAISAEETRLLHAHYGYLAARRAYDAFRPWERGERTGTEGDFEKVEVAVGDFRRLREERLREWVRCGG